MNAEIPPQRQSERVTPLAMRSNDGLMAAADKTRIPRVIDRLTEILETRLQQNKNDVLTWMTLEYIKERGQALDLTLAEIRDLNEQFNLIANDDIVFQEEINEAYLKPHDD